MLQKPERERESMGKRERGEESLWNEEEDTYMTGVSFQRETASVLWRSMVRRRILSHWGFHSERDRERVKTHTYESKSFTCIT